MIGTPSSFGKPFTPWHTPQTTNLPPRTVWASAACPGAAEKIRAATTPSTPKTVETQLFIVIPRLQEQACRPDSSSSTSPHRLRGFENRANDPVMDPAAAEIAGKSKPDVGLARVRVAVENRFGHHDHAGDAVAALRRLLPHESRLQRVGLLKRPETLERDDLGLRKRADRHDAGS